MAEVDAATLACAIFAVLGFFSMFVSTKPATVGGCVMLAATSAAATQALVGLSPAVAGGQQADLADAARSAFHWARETVLG